MSEDVGAGVQLGWLIDPVTEQVHVYRNDGENASDLPVEILDKPSSITADPTLPGFELDLTRGW